MPNNIHSLILVFVMGGVVFLLRAMPFLVFKGDEPNPIVVYMGKYLPYAIMGMLLVYCLRNTEILEAPYGLRELIAVAVTAGLQIWQRKSLLSIVVGTALYMVLVHII